MKPSRVDWGMGGVGVTLALAGVARAGGSRPWNFTLLGLGLLLVLFALHWPQALGLAVIRGLNGLVRKARSDQDAVAAIRLCQSAASAISALPIRETGEISWTHLVPLLISARGESQAIGLYKRRHQAATLHAVRFALRAGALDDGALQLAEVPQVDSDLLELRAELLRIVLELSQTPRARWPAPSA